MDYVKLAGDHPVEIRHINPQKGKGVFARRKILEGEVVITEVPIVACQYSYNKEYFPACAHCIKSLESPLEMLRRLSGHPELGPLPLTDTIFPKIDVTLCDKCGQEKYCSIECKEQAWKNYHVVLCPGKPDPSDSGEPKETPISRLEDAWKKIHFPPETATIMLLARMIAIIRVKLGDSKEKATPEQLFGPFSHFAREFDRGDPSVVHKFLSQKFKDNIDNLNKLVKEALYDERIQDLFTPRLFRSLFCLMCLNAQGVGTSTLERYEQELFDSETPTKEIEEARALVESLEDDIEEVSGQFTHCEGSALFALHTCLNHSCNPNAVSAFPYNNSTIEVIAIRDIEEGEEVNLCYLDDADGMDVKARQEALRDFYLFHCRCDRCIQEEEELKRRQEQGEDEDENEEDDEEGEEEDEDDEDEEEEEEEAEAKEPSPPPRGKGAKRKRADD